MPIKKHLNNLKTIGNIVLAWVFSLFLYYSIIFLTLDQAGIENSIFSWIIFTLSLSLILGLLNGLLEVFIFENRLNHIRFSLVIIYKTSLFFIVFVLSIPTIIYFKNYVLVPLNFHVGEPPKENEVILFFSSSIFYIHAGFAIIMSFMINFFLQIKRKMGKGVLFNLFIGKYHTPRQEERVIMFLDLTSATAIAEKLDLFKYSLFLKDFFSEIDEAIDKTKGAIFQFVGDEVVILWNTRDGFENNNCIRFFYLAQNKISEKKDFFMEKYNVVPKFKAGLHFGNVVITEVGVSKQEIAYHGDTVNSAARIRSVCNDVKRKLLISAELLTHLTDIDEYYDIESIGLSNLKGKKNVIGLFSIEEKNGNNKIK